VRCTNCGIELGTSARFCSGCGKSLAGAPAVAGPTTPERARDWDLHVNVLGWLVIAHAALVGAVGLVVMFGGQFIHNLLIDNPRLLENANPRDVPPPEVFAALGPVTFMIGVIFLLIALPSIIAGVGLLRYRSWGRALTLVLSFLRLLEVPFGTATALYSFWVLLSQDGKRYYNDKAARAEG
jgi:hypothetical protein